VLFKIDVGIGKLDVKSLAELRIRGIYFFTGSKHSTCKASS
jgi:hypothetical protein